MKPIQFIICVICCFFSSTSSSQKRWDGEAFDRKWESPTNWHPDGIPLPTDDIEFNNDFINDTYKVLLPSSTSAVAASRLIIRPSSTHRIILEIPASNMASPAMQANDIIIEKQGEILNKSGATAGNTFQLNGNIIIRNEGRYTHQTIRGNAYIISKMKQEEKTEKGEFVFKVPGSAGYLISLSGRTFGSIRLSSDLPNENKSYNTTGNNDINILGDFIIEQNASFKSTLLGELFIGCGFSNHGNCMISPATADTGKRKIIFKGDSTFFNNTGIFQQNNNFNGIQVSPGTTLKLHSSITFSNSNPEIFISSNASLDLGDHFIEGGRFYSDSSSALLISSPDGISTLPNKGIIRSAQIRIDPKTTVIFYGSSNQQTGKDFPDSLSALIINKPAGNITLSKSLNVTDSILLKKGKVICTDTTLIVFSGNKINPNETQNSFTGTFASGFIEGPFCYISDTASNLYFPIGKGDRFSPVWLKKHSAFRSAHTIEYFNDRSDVYDSSKNYPLEEIDRSQCWKIDCLNASSGGQQNISIALNGSTNGIKGISVESCIAFFDTQKNAWNAKIIFPSDQHTDAVTSMAFPQTKGEFTFGKIRLDVLPVSGLTASAYIKNNGLQINWTDLLQMEVIEYGIEVSTDGVKFNTFKLIGNNINQQGASHNHWIKLDDLKFEFIRISATDNMKNKHYSNIIHIKTRFLTKPPFPNPATKEIFLPIENDEMDIICQILDLNGKMIKPKSEIRNNTLVINLENLSHGAYTLRCKRKDIIENYLFIKN